MAYNYHMKKRREAALKASNNGKLWWIYQYIMAQNVRPFKSPMCERLR